MGINQKIEEKLIIQYDPFQVQQKKFYKNLYNLFRTHKFKFQIKLKVYVGNEYPTEFYR